MSVQLIVATALAVSAAAWFLRGILRDFRPKADCASGCGGCASACPVQAPAQNTGAR